MLDLSIIILCYNEEIHIARSIESALSLTSHVFIIDSYSTDKTLDIASQYNVKIYQFRWDNNTVWADKINWALKNIPFETTWIMRLDSDEYLMSNVKPNLEKSLVNVKSNINGIIVNRRIFFLRKWMRHGNNSYSEIRIVRFGKAYYERRTLDEHVKLSPQEVLKLDCDVADDNLNDLSTFINKHNRYSLNEAIEIINKDINIKGSGCDVSRTRYYKTPKYFRPILLFFSKYFIHLGFLDGKEGFLYIFFQCLWYRMLSDAKADEIYSHCGKDKAKIIQYLNSKYKIEL